MARRDTVAAAMVLLVGAAAAWEATRLPFGAVRNPGQGFFPWWLGLTLAFLSLVLLVRTLVRGPGDSERGGAPVRHRDASGARERGRPGKVLGLLAVLGLYAAALETAGYPLCTFALVLFMLRVTALHRWPLALGVALVAAVGSYVLFGVWLKVPLPAGPF